MTNSQRPTRIRLGLIGDAIHASRSPLLHRLAGAQCGLDVGYELLIPPERGEDFETVLDWAGRDGFAGVNITYPYKERVTALIDVPDPAVARLGACNTVLFARGGDARTGHNTDHSGFLAAWRARFGATSPGRVALIGTGGVGRAIGFALVALGAPDILLCDADPARAERLAADLAALSTSPGHARTRFTVLSARDMPDALAGADGAVNATPMGMQGKPGCPVPLDSLGGLGWVFDAVYTPTDTIFLTEAARRGAATLSGWELFFHQGLDAFRLFTGQDVPDPAALRRDLDGPPAPAQNAR